ncbi:MAG: M48 family metalloprotease, partial [Acidaminococcus sp.]|nr:M48 family metalloprotease [Acidaminococcus sp.]
MLKILFTLLLCLASLLPLPKAEAAMISQKQEIEMGQEVAKQLENQYGLVQDDDIQARVDRIGHKLLEHGTRPGLTYTFKVLNTPDVNALACPGGFIYVYKGLLDYMTSDDEVAAVLGHEIGHIEKRHTVHQLEKQMALSLLTLLAGVASGDPGAGFALSTVTSQALMAGYSRADEGQADQEGFR